ncbi:MAG TPA: DUF6297 family protein [Streptosporangiaceae bacterium]
MTGPGQATVPARVPLRRLRKSSRSGLAGRARLVDISAWAAPTAVIVALAIGAVRPLARLLTETGWAVPGAPGRLFVVAALLLLLGGLAQVLRSAGPVTASSAFWFWLLSAPVRRRDLLRRRYLALLAVTAVLACTVAGLVAHAGSAPVLPAVAAAVLAAVALAAGAVCGQAWEITDHVGHAVGQAMRSAGVLAFGSLATGAGRVYLNSVLRAPPSAAVILLAALAVTAAACCVLGYRALDRIEVSVLRRGQGLWTAGSMAAVSMDVFMLTEFLADRRARQAGRVRPARIGAGFATALVRSELTRLRRRHYLAGRAAAAAVVWWGCRPVLHGPVLAAVAVVTGYCLVLPVAGTLRQLAANPGLRAQFAPRDRWLSFASLAACLLASATWTAIVAPGLGGGVALAILIAAGLTAAVYRTVTRPPLDYSGPLVPTPFGDLPLDLWRQIFRGPLLLAVLIAVTAAITAR